MEPILHSFLLSKVEIFRFFFPAGEYTGTSVTQLVCSMGVSVPTHFIDIIVLFLVRSFSFVYKPIRASVTARASGSSPLEFPGHSSTSVVFGPTLQIYNSFFIKECFRRVMVGIVFKLLHLNSTKLYSERRWNCSICRLEEGRAATAMRRGIANRNGLAQSVSRKEISGEKLAREIEHFLNSEEEKAGNRHKLNYRRKSIKSNEKYKKSTTITMRAKRRAAFIFELANIAFPTTLTV